MYLRVISFKVLFFALLAIVLVKKGDLSGELASVMQAISGAVDSGINTVRGGG